MELLFVWVQNYRKNNNDYILKNIGVNFSWEFKFKFNYKLKNESERLTFSLCDSFIENFFTTETSKSNIQNITFIVGENGVGKTSILDFIKELYMFSLPKECNYFIIYRLENKKEFFIINNTKYEIPLFNTNNYKLSNSNKKLRELNTLIYYSNIFGKHQSELSQAYKSSLDFSDGKFASIFDLSTDFLVKNDYLHYFNKSKHRIPLTLFKLISPINIHLLKEKKRQINFINNNDFEQFNLPIEIELIINELEEKVVLKEISKKYSELTIAIFTEAEKNIDKKDIKKFKLYKAAFYNLINIMESSTNFFSYPINLKKILFSIDIENNFFLNFKELLKSLKKCKVKTIERKLIVNPLANTIDRLIEFLHDFDLLYKEINNEFLLVDLTSDYQKEVFNRLFDSYFKYVTLTNFLNFNFRNFSSGETSLLNLYSRFYSIKNSNVDLYDSLLIVMDEVDLYFHPNWQRKLIFLLINLLSNFFHDKKIQLIITSHSPFVLSDASPDSVIFLRRENGQLDITDRLETKKETFGANIHELFTDSFFMKEGLIGEFALNKINTLIKDIKSKEIFSDEDIILLMKKINLIGEPFIKNKLNEMLLEKSPSKFLDEEIRIKEKELEQLKKKRK